MNFHCHAFIFYRSSLKGRLDRRRPLSPGVRIKLGNSLMRSRVTLTSSLAQDLIEAALFNLQSVVVSKPSSAPLAQQISAATGQQQQQSQASSSPPAQALPCPTHGSVPADQIRPPQQLQTSRPSVNAQRRLANHGLDLLTHLLDK